MRFSVFAVALLMLLGSPAAAEGDAPVPGVQPALTVGAFELVGVSPEAAHLGVYVAASVDLLVPLGPDWMVIPSLGFEFCPEFGNWGGTLYVIADRFLAKLGNTTVTVQAKLGVLHDALPADEGFEHGFFASFGAGTALVTPHGTWLPGVTANVGLAGEGWSLSPTLLFSVPF